MNKPPYMQAEWFQGLVREVEATSKTAVAARMDVARTTLSIFIHGKGEYGTGRAKPDQMELRYRRAFEQLECTHTGVRVGIEHCRSIALGPVPMHNPLKHQNWQACQECPFKPAPAAGMPPVAPVRRAKRQPQEPLPQAAIDRVTLPLPEVGGPQVADLEESTL